MPCREHCLRQRSNLAGGQPDFSLSSHQAVSPNAAGLPPRERPVRLRDAADDHALRLRAVRQLLQVDSQPLFPAQSGLFRRLREIIRPCNGLSWTFALPDRYFRLMVAQAAAAQSRVQTPVGRSWRQRANPGGPAVEAADMAVRRRSTGDNHEQKYEPGRHFTRRSAGS